MRTFTTALVVLTIALSAKADETVIPLKLDTGGFIDGRDCRTFSIPVVCNGQQLNMAWGCGGWTIVSQSFANKAHMRPHGDSDTEDILDGQGRHIFAGCADAVFELGGEKIETEVKIMTDAAMGRGSATLGYAIARKFQWTLDPDPVKPTLTLRAPGSALPEKCLAVMPLKDKDDQLWITIFVRGEDTDVRLMPQANDTQAAPDLQKKWDLNSGKGQKAVDFHGTYKTFMLKDKSTVQFTKEIVESNVMLFLVGDPKNPEPNPFAQSGAGASLLSRFSYCVDPEQKKFVLIARTPKPPATQPAKK